MSRLFIGNIPFNSSESDLQQWFERHGFAIKQVEIIQDRVTGQSRGFGFVELEEPWKAEEVVNRLHKKSLAGRALTISFALPIGSNRRSHSEFAEPAA